MKYYIDCGGHFGEGMKNFIDMYSIDENWKIITFEPNIESFEILKNFKYKNCNIEFNNRGVWIKNEKMKFRPEKTSISYGQNVDGAASTFIKESDWFIKNPNNTGAGDFLLENEYDIEVIDFESLLKELVDVEFLLVKMDIEGCEYEILRKLIQTETIKIIDDLYVEFHDWAMNSETNQSTEEIINKITQMGVNIKKWI